MMDDLISRQVAIDAFVGVKVDEECCSEYEIGYNDGIDFAVSKLSVLPSAQPEWNNHKVACLLAELYDDTCACNYNSIDEWLPEKCELLESCPHTVGVACWEQFLKHKAERRTDGSNR